MNRRFFLTVLVLMAGILHIPADNHIVQKFTGVEGSGSTGAFTVPDKWEVLWTSSQPANISLLALDGTVLAGAAGMGQGSFYIAKGGSFYVQVNANTPGAKVNWSATIMEVGSGSAPTADPNSTTTAMGMFTYSPPASVLAPGTASLVASTLDAPPLNPQTMVDRRPLPSTPPPLFGTTNAPGSTAATPPAPPAAVGKLTPDQANAIVIVKGDNAQGSGFLVKTADGFFVVTNNHVISNNPNVKILTSGGAEIQTTSFKGASDRDLVMFGVKDAGYHYLEIATDVSNTAQTGDEVITPGNSQGGEVTINTDGKIVGLGPQRIEFDNPIYHGNSGGPVFHTKSSKVVGVVTEAIKVDTSNELDKTSFANHSSAIGNSLRYFGLRLDTVSKWEVFDMQRFLNETSLLEQFHEESRCLDSYMNAKEGTPDAKLYQSDEKIRSAEQNFQQDVAGADSSQRLSALRQLFFDLNGIADNNMNALQDAGSFYSYNQVRANEEVEYRKALKKELEAYDNDISRLGHLARKNN